jgi:hypothetical protein
LKEQTSNYSGGVLLFFLFFGACQFVCESTIEKQQQNKKTAACKHNED